MEYDQTTWRLPEKSTMTAAFMESPEFQVSLLIGAQSAWAAWVETGH